MSEIEELIEEVGAADFRPLTSEQRERRRDSVAWDYDPDTDTTISLDQARRFSEAAEGKIASTHFEDDEEFFDLWEQVLDDWPEVEVRFAGMIGEWGYLDAVYLCYDEVPEQSYGHNQYDFEKYCVYHFKHWMSPDKLDNKGICPLCHGGVEVRSHEELFRVDDNLWAEPDEFDIREYPDLGKTVRLWWDD